MADTLKVYQFEDTVTGKIIKFEGPADASEEEINAYLESQTTPQEPTATDIPQVTPTVSMQNGPSWATGTNREAIAPNAQLGYQPDAIVPTRALEEIPGAREDLSKMIFSDLSFEELSSQFAQKYPEVRIGDSVTPQMLADIRAFSQTPEGQQYYANNFPAGPVNRATGVEDPRAPTTLLGEFGTSAKRSLANMANTITGAGGLVADLVGAEDTSKDLLDTYVNTQAAIGQEYPSSAGGVTDIGSIGDAARWGASVAGELLPQITLSLGAGALGGMAARKMTERGAADFVESRVASGVAQDVAEAEAANLVKKRAMQGQIGGAFASSEVQETGSVYGDTYGATGERKPWSSLLAGTAAASLDSILPARVLGKIGGTAGESALVGSLVKRLGKEAASSFLIEGGTEALQTIIEQLPAGKGINWDSVVEAAARGSFGGAVVGSATSTYQNVMSPQEGPKGNTNPPAESAIVVPDASRRTKAYKAQIDGVINGIIDQINGVTSEWANPPSYEVHQNLNFLPKEERSAIGAIADGKVVINSEAVLKEAKKRGVTPETIVNAVVYHEGLGHHGMTQLFGDALDTKLADILAASPTFQRKVQDWLDKNPSAYENDPNRDIRAFDEILAEQSESGKLPASIVNILLNTVKDFGRKMGLNLEYSTREVETILGMAHAAVISGKGRDVASNGFRFMNIGESSRRIQDQSGAIRAQAMLARGETPEAVKAATGWWKDQDGGWRRRIADNTSGFLVNEQTGKTVLEETFARRNTVFGGSEQTTLGAVFSHPELFEAYPFLKDIKIKHDEGDEYYGSYNHKTDTITINPTLMRRHDEDIVGTLLHEIQHAIQDSEGWAQGGNSTTALAKTLKPHEVEPAFEVLIKERGEFAATLDDKLEKMRKWWADPQVKEYYAITEAGKDKPAAERLEGRKEQYLLGQKLVAEGIVGQDDIAEFTRIFQSQDDPRREMRALATDLNNLDQHIVDMMETLDAADIQTMAEYLNSQEKVRREAYEWLLGEIEARETDLTRNWPQDQMDKIPGKIGHLENRDPSYARIVKNGRAVSASMPGEPIIRPKIDGRTEMEDRRLRRRVANANEDAEYETLRRLGIDPSEAGLPPRGPVNRYMMPSSPDKIVMTSEEIADMTPEELFESENAMNILNSMTEGYTPVVMSLDDLRKEAEDRNLPPSRVLRNNSIGAGEIVKRLYMYDIAMEKMHSKVTELWNKLQSGDFTEQDRANYLQTIFKMNELTARIFEDQGEIGRALAAIRSLQFTKRRVEGVQQTIAQFKKGSPFEVLNDPDEFYRFAQNIQSDIEASKTTKTSKGMEIAANALNLPRALMSSMDLSAPLRQGLFLIHKRAWWSSFFNMFRYAGSTRAFNDLMEGIVNRPSYQQMLQGNLALSNLDTALTQREEAFMSTWAEKIPGIGKLIRASERAYVGFLNKLRADVFDQLLAKLPEGYTEKDLKDIASFINAASGRGNLPKVMQSATPLLNGLFFSPRLIASRLKMSTVLVDPRTYTSMNPVARNEYIKSLVSIGALALLITSLMSLGGAETERDPRSSDFGKVRFGNTRYDILGGEGQYITLGARLFSNSYKTSEGAVKEYGTKFGQTNRFDALTKFATNKAAPIPSFVIEYLRGVSATGEKFNADRAVLSRFTPMFVQDVAKAVAEDGLGVGIAKSVPGVFGVGAQTYAPASEDVTRELETPEDFQMDDLQDGEYSNNGYKYSSTDGKVSLGEDAKLEWNRRVNFYFQEWIKDEMNAPTWASLSEKEQRDVISEVRKDARKQGKEDMLEILGVYDMEEGS